MDMLRSALTVSKVDREAFERAQRRFELDACARAEFLSNVDVLRSKAEAKRDRRRQRNLLHCS